MPFESGLGEGPQWEMPLDPAPEAARPAPASPPPRPGPTPPRSVPTARPVATPRAFIRTRPEPTASPAGLTPAKVRGWGGSVALHVLLLIVLALWAISIRSDAPPTIVGGLAGSPFGSETGDALAGGLGMDEPLALPEAPESMLQSATLTITPPSPVLEPDPSALRPRALSPTPAGASGGGVELAGTGRGGLGDGFGVARFGTGTERVQGVEVKIGDPQFTLIWEGRGDVDLHVEEPGGSHIYWFPDNRIGRHGGELDVDNREGPGPENIYWPGRGPNGVYRWFVEYYGPAPLDRYRGPVKWRVRIKHNGKLQEFKGSLGTIGDRSKSYTLTVGSSE